MSTANRQRYIRFVVVHCWHLLMTLLKLNYFYLLKILISWFPSSSLCYNWNRSKIFFLKIINIFAFKRNCTMNNFNCCSFKDLRRHLKCFSIYNFFSFQNYYHTNCQFSNKGWKIYPRRRFVFFSFIYLKTNLKFSLKAVEIIYLAPQTSFFLTFILELFVLEKL
jgi:hypothetical protein